MKIKIKKDSNTKEFSINNQIMADIMFFLRPMKERQMELMFWSSQLKRTEDDIVKSLGVDSEKWICDWANAYRTGKLVCKRKEIEKDGKNKKK